MENRIVDIEFTKPLNSFLAGLGYTHIYSIGVDDEDCSPETDNKAVYWLEPLKPGDSRIEDTDADCVAWEILSKDVLDMTDGHDNTVFMIKVPVEDLKLYEIDK